MGSGTERVSVRAARPDEATTLSDLVLRSKASWGYDRDTLATYRDALHLRPDEVVDRRTLVAERAGRIAGVATLEGEPPDGRLGLLFVEPAVLRSGVGRALYTRVLADAGRTGFRRVLIDSDPHAEPFYRALGAERSDEAAHGPLRALVAWPVEPEPAWSAAWNRSGRTVHLGNVAEFNGQFGAGGNGPDHYSCAVAFCGLDPAMLVLPEAVEDWWVADVARVLGWRDVAVHSGLAADGRTSAAIRSSRALRDAVAARGPAVRAWGLTPDLGTLVPVPAAVLGAIRRYESKRHAHALFRSLAPDHPGVVVPAQRPAGSARALRRSLSVPVVLKREYGVGGSGTLIVGPGTPGRRRIARSWAREDVIVEDYVEGGGPYRDSTFDGLITTGGQVHPVGVGLMDVEGTGYRGVTVGPGVLPSGLTAAATGFGLAVGTALAADGYEGWYDVDFVTGRSGRLAPTEINLRLTGPAVAFHLRAALDRRRGGAHVVRVIDRLPLGARLPPAMLRDHVGRLTEDCRALGATLLVTIPTAAYEPCPTLGVAIAARDVATVDSAEETIRATSAGLSAMFAGLDVSGRGARWPRRRSARPRRASASG